MKEIDKINFEERLTKIKSRQLARLMDNLREINTPVIVLEVVKRYFHFFYEDTKQLFKELKDQNDSSL